MPNLIHFAEISVSVNYRVKDNYVFQQFVFNRKKKNTKLITDSRYRFYDKFEKKIRDLSLVAEGVIAFRNRVDEENNVTLKYEIIDENRFNKYDLKNFIFKLVDYVPPNPGCAFCVHKKNDDGTFFYCDKKEKTLSKELKTCKVFRQRNLYYEAE